MLKAQTPNDPRETDASTSALIAIGLGCYLGWQTIDISPTLFPAPAPGVQDALVGWAYAGTALLVVLLAAFAAYAWRRGPLLRSPWIVALAALGPSVGTAVLYACGWLSDPASMPGVALGRTLAGTSAAFVVLWGELLCRTKPSHTLACVAAGYAVSFGICLIEANLSPLAALTLRPLLPLLSGAVLTILRHDLLPIGAATPPAGEAMSNGTGPNTAVAAKPATPPASRTAPLPLRLSLGTGILGAIFVATNHLSETKTEVSTELYTLVAGIVVAAALVAIAIATRGMHGNFSLLYRLITPLVIGCLLLTLVLQPGRQYYEALAIGGTWAFFRIFTWTLWGRIGMRDPKGGACVFALGQICLTLCSTVGELLCSIVDLSAAPLAVAASAIIFVAVFTSAFVMDEGSVAKLVTARGEGAVDAPDSPGSGREGEDLDAADTTASQTPFDANAVTLEHLAHAIADLGLSEREREIALLVLKRHDNRRICQEAYITESTLRTHLRNIYGKTGAHSRTGLIELLERRLRQDRGQPA